jgi:DNA-binding response OmpR family regulator
MPTKKILIVEDERPILRAITSFLTLEGFAVLPAEHGRQAFEILLNEIPDFIIADVLMPGVDGFEFLKTLRGYVWGANIPVVLYTNLDPREVQKNAQKYRVLHCLPKADPRSIERLIAIIKKELSLKE